MTIKHSSVHYKRISRRWWIKEAEVSLSPSPQELDTALTEWEASYANDAGYENLSDEAIVDSVRGSEGPEESGRGRW